MAKNFFSKLIDGLFDEVEVEDESNEVTQEEVDYPNVSNVILPEQAKPVTLKEKSVEEEPIKKEILIKEARPTMINVDEIKEPVKKPVVIERKTKPEFEPTQIISPIYGVVKTASTTESSTAMVSSAKKAPKNNSVLGTVLSPIYGMVQKEETVTPIEMSMETEEEDVSLDDLIEKPEVEVKTLDSEENDADLESLMKTLPEEEPEEKTVSTKKMIDGQNLSLFDDFENA